MSELPKETPINPGLSSVTAREQGGSSVTEQSMPHPGGRNVPEQLREQPVREFDNTSLGEALDQGYLEVPTSPSPIPEAQPAVLETYAPHETQVVSATPEGKGWSLKTKFIAIGATVLTAAGAIVAAMGISNAANSNNPTENLDGPKTDPKGTTEVTPGPITPETPDKSPEQIEAEEILNMPKPERWDELDAMTLEEFNQQPIEARVEYAGWLNRDAKRLAGLWYEASGNPRDQIAINLTVSPENTGEEIKASVRSLQRGAISRHFDQFELDEVPLYENLQREKMISASFLYPDGPGAENWRETARNERVNGIVPGVYVKEGLMLADEEVIARSDNYIITDQSGVERTAVSTTYREANGTETTSERVLVQTPTISQWVVLK